MELVEGWRGRSVRGPTAGVLSAMGPPPTAQAGEAGPLSGTGRHTRPHAEWGAAPSPLCPEAGEPPGLTRRDAAEADAPPRVEEGRDVHPAWHPVLWGTLSCGGAPSTQGQRTEEEGGRIGAQGQKGRAP